MFTQIFIFAVSLFIVIQSSVLATRYAARIANGFNLSKYTVGFIVIAIISILPETFISVNSALEGVPSFGFGMLLGSNVADLTIVFALIAFFAHRPLKVEGQILKSHVLYPFILLLPIVLGLNGELNRPEGAGLILTGIIFYYMTLKRGNKVSHTQTHSKGQTKSILLLLLSMALLLLGAHFTVTSASSLAILMGISPVLIGMLIVGLGTTMPEFFFSLRAVRAHDDSLAIGDILGTVLADATIVVGILTLIQPFTFPTEIIYVAGVFMVAAAFILFSFMRSGKNISGKEAFALLVLWIAFIAVECIVNL